MNWGLKQRDIDAMIGIFNKYDTIDRVYIFGSRAKGNYHDGSDIDLAIAGEAFNPDLISNISYILNEELPIPYFVDVLFLNNVKNPDLTDHINRVGQLFYSKSSNS